MSASTSRIALAAAALLATAAAQTDPRNDPRNDPSRPATATDPAHRDPMQDPAAPRDTTRDPMNRERAQALSAQHGDAIIATWLLGDNEKEVALARLAAERAQSQEVKDFAQMMIRDHEPMVQKLRQAAHAGGEVGFVRDASGNRAGVAGTDRPDADRPGGARDPAKEITGDQGREVAQGEAKLPAKTPERTTEDAPDRARTPAEVSGTAKDRAAADRSGLGEDRTGMDHDPNRAAAPLGETGRAAGPFRTTAVLQELSRKCTDRIKGELSQKQGADFDRVYMKMAVLAHQEALDKVQVFRRHASANLNPTLAEAERTVQAHLDHAKNLCKKVEGK